MRSANRASDKNTVFGTLEGARIDASPRLSPRAVPWASSAIRTVILLAFAVLAAQAFLRDCIFAWSVGLAYISYDTFLLAFTGWQARAIFRTPTSQAAMPAGGARPDVAVIIAARNEHRAIAPTLDAILSQTDPPEAIIVADDGSTDATGDVLARDYGLVRPDAGRISEPSGAVPRLRWLRLHHGGKARALNAALGHVTSDIIVTVDADTLLDPDAIAAIRRRFAAETRLVAAGGVLRPMCSSGLPGRVFEAFQGCEYVRNFISRYAWMQVSGLLLVSGAFAAFRRDAVVAVGGFDPDCLVEDYELIHRLRRWSTENGQDWTVRVVGDARARTDAPETAGAFLRQRRRWFAGFLETQHWNRDMIGNPAFGNLGTRMMPVKAVDTLQPVYGIVAFLVLLKVLLLCGHQSSRAILAVMGAKIAFDLALLLWYIRLYRRWTGDPGAVRALPAAVVAIFEPFTFQLLRHSAAVLGWWVFLTGRRSWGRQSRAGISSQSR